jgi:ribosomal protein S18 acetylase RimI-like enzyme
VSFQVRAAILDEVGLVYQVTQAAFSEYREVLPSLPGALQETLADVEQSMREGGAVLALEEGAYLAGAARYKLLEDALYIGRVAVLPTYRRRGVGGLLLSHLEDLGRSLGKSEVHLSTRQSLPGNVAFYESLGYTVIGIEPYPAPIADYSLALSKLL